MNQFEMVAPMNKHSKGNKISYIYIFFFFLEIGGIWNQLEGHLQANFSFCPGILLSLTRKKRNIAF